MASPDIDYPWLSPTIESFDGSFNICIDDSESSAWSEVPSSVCYGSRIPEPPPPPCKISTRTRLHRRLGECYFVPKETKDMWDKLFKEGYGADVYVITEEREIIPAHSSVLVSKFNFITFLILPSFKSCFACGVSGLPLRIWHSFQLLGMFLSFWKFWLQWGHRAQ